MTTRPLHLNSFNISKTTRRLHNSGWECIGLNERFKIYRYSGPDQYFASHYDGSFERVPLVEQSWVTMLVYLNEDFEGGQTSFIDGEIEPETGLAAFMTQHNYLHEAREATRRFTKYVLRTDVMYRKIRRMMMNKEMYEELMLKFAKELTLCTGVTQTKLKKSVESQYNKHPNVVSCSAEEATDKFQYRFGDYQIEAQRSVKTCCKEGVMSKSCKGLIAQQIMTVQPMSTPSDIDLTILFSPTTVTKVTGTDMIDLEKAF